MNKPQPLPAPSNQPLSPREGYRLVLNMLRHGALEQAEKEYVRLELYKVTGDEDILALGGRLLKTRALEKTGKERVRLARRAADQYQAAYCETGGTYSGINTAALLLVGGHKTQAIKLAAHLRDELPKTYPEPGEDAYYHMATVAEAHLILGETDEAIRVLSDALHLDPHNYPAHATTLVQFSMILEALGENDDWLEAFRPPKAVHYAGHIFGAEGCAQVLEPAYIHGLEKAITDLFEKHSFGFAYGALAAGSDILLAERLLAIGAELHVVLPCSKELFLDTSVRPFGGDWEERFHACMKAAKSTRSVSENADTVDDLALAFGSEVAMGHAVLQAQRLATDAMQVLVWDGQIPSTGAGTARDAALWSKTGRKQLVVPYPAPRDWVQCDDEPKEKKKSRRGLKAMVFADVRGFGALPDALVPVFLKEILEPLAQCLKEQGHKIKHLNTWGDGLFLVLDNVQAAADAALDLQQCFEAIDLREAGLPEFLALRVAGHYGPVFEMEDPFLCEKGVFGTEVSFAARIEPVTVPGSIYVSEPFACALAANTKSGYRCEFVGEVQPRKQMPDLPLFSLRRR